MSVFERERAEMSVVGIDPGQHTGLAIYEKGKLMDLQTVSPDRLQASLAEMAPTLVIFEDSRKTSKTFTAGKAKSFAAALKIARNVGEIDRLCKDIETICQRLNIECYGIEPLAKGAKVNAAQFNAITGWPGRSSQHARDAAMVAWPYRNKAAKA